MTSKKPAKSTASKTSKVAKAAPSPQSPQPQTHHDAEIEQVQGDRFYELAQLMQIGVDHTPTALHPKDEYAQQLDLSQVGQPQAAPAPLPPPLDVDNPVNWQQPPVETMLQSLAAVQAPPFSPPPYQAPPAQSQGWNGQDPWDDEQVEDEPQPRPRKRRKRHPVWQQKLIQYVDQQAVFYLLAVMGGGFARFFADRFLSAGGLQLFDYSSFGLLAIGVIFAFGQREFYYALAIVVGIAIEKWVM